MNRLRFLTSGRVLGAIAVSLLMATNAVAQGTPPNDQEPLVPKNRRGFDLMGLADFALVGMRSAGRSAWKVTSSGPSDDQTTLDANLPGRVIGTPSSPTAYCCGYFELQLWAVAPASDYQRNLERAPSLENVVGGGFAASTNLSRWVPAHLWAWQGRDGSVGTLYSGVTSTTDGSCRDNSSLARNDDIGEGLPLLAGSDCPDTWARREIGFEGERPVPDTIYLRDFRANPTGFNFDDWRYGPSDRAEKIYGSFQTFGASVDYGRERRARFGNVIPGGSGTPQLQGYPLGLEFSFQAFSYAVPTIAEGMIYKALVINKSEEVYGVGLDYDSLYLGFQVRPFHTTSTQQPAVYAVPSRGVIFSNQTNTNQQNCYGGVHGSNVTGGYTAGTDIRSCLSNTHANRGFRGGAGALIVFKSPIGDLRNKKFSDPSSPFYAPSNPLAADTFTFNQLNACGFTCATSYGQFGDRVRATYGALANMELDALAGLGKSPGDPTERQYFDLFHTPEWPTRWTPANPSVGGFARYVPRTASGTPWDYDHNGTPDTMKVLTCYGTNPATSGCQQPWTDTLPGGFPNGVHNNYFAGAGPVKLHAGDTTSFVVAFLSSPDSVTIETTVNNFIDLYQSFWLSPEPPCPVQIVAAEARGGNRQFDTNVRLYFDQSVNQCRDVFLFEQARLLKRRSTDTSATGSPADRRLRVLNPRLVNQIFARAVPRGTILVDTVSRTFNKADIAYCASGTATDFTTRCRVVTDTAVGVVDSLYVFKSCDGGTNYTATTTAACTPAPARDPSGAAPGFPWQAYATLGRDATGKFPSQFNDGGVTGGLTYTYVVAGVSFPAIFDVVDSIGGLLRPTQYTIRPKTPNSLTANPSNPNVSVVYVPASRQAGSDTTAVQYVTTADTIAAYSITARLAKQIRGSAPIQGQFILSDSAEVIVTDATLASPAPTSTTVTLFGLVDSTTTPSRRVAYRTRTFTLDSTQRVDVLGRASTLVTSDVTVGGVRTITYRFRARGPQATMVINGLPQFVTDSFPANDITPAATLVRPEFPGLLIAFDPARAGTLNTQFWSHPSLGVIRSPAWPTISWNTAGSNPRDNMARSRYKITWSGPEFGPGAPFRLDAFDPSRVNTAFNQSLAARTDVQTTVNDAAAIQALNDAFGASRVITADSLAVLSMPFTIRNRQLDDAVVKVAVIKSERPGVSAAFPQPTALFGSAGDTARVTIPNDKWVPGDRLYFLEQFYAFRTQTVAGVTSVVFSGGKPDSVLVTRVTWGPITIGCQTPTTCNPLTGVGSTGYTVVSPQEELNVVYYQPITGATLFPGSGLTTFDFTITPDISGTQITSVSSGDLSNVRVVPNPYVMFSQYEQVNNVKRLLFTNLPPTGTIRVYTASGQFVQQINWVESDLERNCTSTTSTTQCQATGDLTWDMRTRENLEIGPGFYVFVVSTNIGGGKKDKLGKFVVIH